MSDLIHKIVGKIIEVGQSDTTKFRLGETIRYSPSEILEILKQHESEIFGEGSSTQTNAFNTLNALDTIYRQAAKDRLTILVDEIEGIFADIRERNVDDSVCGLCEYDCDHGIDGSAFECPGFERDDCFKLKDEYREEWTDVKALPSAQPVDKDINVPTNDTISRQAAIDALVAYIKINKAPTHYENQFWVEGMEDAGRIISDLPSAEPERKKGKWIRNDNGTFSCDQCNSWIPNEQHYYARYCLHCGAEMEG